MTFRPVEDANRKGFKVKVKFKSNIGAYIYSSIYFPEQKLRSKVSLIICFYRLQVSILARKKRRVNNKIGLEYLRVSMERQPSRKLLQFQLKGKNLCKIQWKCKKVLTHYAFLTWIEAILLYILSFILLKDRTISF